MAVVAHLTAEGYSVVDMAEILGVNEKTVRRDRDKLRTQNAFRGRPGFAAEVAGQLMHEAETTISQIRRALRDKDASVADRIQGQRAAWLTYTEYVEKLQRLGYLPTAPTEVHALHSLGGESPSQAATHLQAELLRIEEIARNGPGLSQDEAGQIQLVRAQLQTVQIRERVQSSLPESKETPS